MATEAASLNPRDRVPSADARQQPPSGAGARVREHHGSTLLLVVIVASWVRPAAAAAVGAVGTFFLVQVGVWLYAACRVAWRARRLRWTRRLWALLLIVAAGASLVRLDSLSLRLPLLGLGILSLLALMRPRFSRTLHFRLTATFLVLLAMSATAWWIWINQTVWSVTWQEGEKDWYDTRFSAELDSLAQTVQPLLSRLAGADSAIVGYYDRVKRFDVELSLVDSLGYTRTTTRPESLLVQVCRVDPAILDSMTAPDWDFSSYPDAYEVESFVNRITHIRPLRASPDPRAPASAYLVATFRPTGFTHEAERKESRSLLVLGSVVVLVTAALSGVLVMAWISRRINRLSRSVESYRQGDLARRVPAHDGDELGRLGRDFNAMAATLADQIEQLRKSEEFHRRLVANMSHDLRTPLAALRGYVETLALEENAGPSPQRQHYLKRISANVGHIERLIQHLFQLSKLDAGEVRFEMENFSIEELGLDLIRLFQGLAEERGLDLQYVTDADLPLVHADPIQIGQVLQNLLENALKFTSPGQYVRLHLHRCAGGVDVGVEDNGPGIAAKDLPHVTERFYTADPGRSRKGESSGLGLAIAEKILLQHGTQLRIFSEPGRVTCFRFTLPAATAAQA